jgi:hypothetical protein
MRVGCESFRGVFQGLTAKVHEDRDVLTTSILKFVKTQAMSPLADFYREYPDVGQVEWPMLSKVKSLGHQLEHTTKGLLPQ